MRSYGITNAAPYASAPAVGAAGDTYYNTGSKILYLSDGTAWNAVSGGGGGQTVSQTLGSAALTNKTNNPSGSWVDWGTIAIPLTVIPVGSLNTVVFGLLTGFASDFVSSSANVPQSRLACSFDNGATWTYSPTTDGTSLSQISPTFTNRSNMTTSFQWTQAAATTGQVLLKAQGLSNAPSGNTTFASGELTWQLPLGVKGDKGDNVVSDLAKWNSAWGDVVAPAVVTSSGGWTANTVADWFSLTFTPVVGRRYALQIKTLGVITANPGCSMTIGIRDSANVGIDQMSFSPATINAGEAFMMTTIVTPSTATPITYKVYYLSSRADTSVYCYADSGTPTRFRITDVGPVTPAANTPPQGVTPVVAAGNAIGVVAVGAGIDGATSSGGLAIITNPLSVTFIAGRRYRIIAEVRAVGTTGRAYLYDVGLGTPWSTGINGDRWMQSSGAWAGRHLSWIFNGDGTTKSIQVRIDNISGTNSFYCPEFYVEDIGPSSYPALPLPPANLDTNQAWVTFTPALHVGASIGVVNSNCSYYRIGRMVTARYALQAVSFPPAGQYDVDLPFTARMDSYINTWATPIGVATYTQSSGYSWQGQCMTDVPTAFWIGTNVGGTNLKNWQQGAGSAGYPCPALVNDTIRAMITYEAAS